MNDIIELKDITKELDNLVDPLIELLLPQNAGVASLVHATFKLPGAFRDYRLYQKFSHFLTAIAEQDLRDSVKFSNQLFSDINTARENGLRLIQYIDRAETLTVVDYMVNASRAAANQLININEYYRILWALSNTYPEDLHYFKGIVTTEGLIQGNTQVIALSQSGLMISAGIDANRSAEDQDYDVTSFGILVDRYALSLNDEERWEYWRERDGKRNSVNFKAPTARFDGDTLVITQ